MAFHHIYYKYSQVHNTKTICLFELFQKHFSNIIVYCTTTGSLKTIDRLTDLKKAKNTVSKYTPFWGVSQSFR